jgi:hypothetical protein
MVYRELLLNTCPLVVHFRSAFWFETGSKPQPAILVANKQIHDEAAAVLYGENTWFSAAGIGVFQFGEVVRGHSSIYDMPPGPLDMYLPRIKRFVLFADGPPNWFRDGVVARGDVASMLRRLGIQRDGLTHFAVTTFESQMCDDIADANGDWLTKADDREMQSMFTWYKDSNPQRSQWLVLRDKIRTT